MTHLRLCTAHSLVLGFACSIGLASATACDPATGVYDTNVTPVADARVLGKDKEKQNAVVDYAGAPVAVTLDGSFSKDPDGSIKKYKWFSGTRRPGTGGAAGAAAGSGAAGMGAGGAGMGAGGAGMGAGGAGMGAGGAGMGAGGAGMGAGGAGMGAGGAGMAAAGAAGTSEQRWVPPGEEQDWPDDVEKPVVTLGEGEFKFVLWVEDDKGMLSNPSTLKVTVRTPVSPEVQMCADAVYKDVPATCKTCVCGVSEECLTLTSAATCDATCWSFLQCLATKCPNFRSGDTDTSCVAANCSGSLGGAAAAQMIAPCYTPCRMTCSGN